MHFLQSVHSLQRGALLVPNLHRYNGFSTRLVNTGTICYRLLQCSKARWRLAQGTGGNCSSIVFRHFEPRRTSTTLAMAKNCAALDSNLIPHLKRRPRRLQADRHVMRGSGRAALPLLADHRSGRIVACAINVLIARFRLLSSGSPSLRACSTNITSDLRPHHHVATIARLTGHGPR